MQIDSQHNLKTGTILQNYEIIRVLGAGGFGITYLAQDIKTKKEVVIKEYFPNDLAIRNFGSSIVAKTNSEKDFTRGMERFKEEAKTLIQFKHHSIVKILGYFEANNTAYFVMKYEGGIDLDKYMKQHSSPFSQDEIIEILMPILEGLKEVHRHRYLHRDIKPANILLRENSTPVLIDFGASKIALGEVSKSLTTILTPGYAPPEQYSSDVTKQGAFTDLYSVAAVMYKMIIGAVPSDAQTRVYALLSNKKDPYEPLNKQNLPAYDNYFLKAIDKALSLDAKKRPKNVQEFQKNIFGEVKADISQPTEMFEGTPVSNNYEPSGMFSFEGRISRSRFWLSNIILIIFTYVILILLATKGGKDTQPIVVLISIIATWINLGINVKRWHDIDMSGWWSLLGIIPPVALILGFIKGTEGSNRFGVDPLGVVVSANEYDENETFNENDTVNNTPSELTQVSNDSVTLLGVGHSVPPIILTPNRQVTVGRSNRADITIDNKYISGEHLAFTLEDDARVIVRDLSSSNGTYLEGRKLDPNVPYEFKAGKKLLIASEDVVYTL